MKRVFLTIVFLFFIKIIVFSQNSNEFTLTKVTFNISNVNENNKTQLDNQLKEIKGIYKYEINYSENIATTYLTNNLSKEDFQTKLNNLGYNVVLTLGEVSSHKIKGTQKSNESDYPKFINTGNSENDNADFANRKSEWIKNNPEKYKNLSTKNSNTETDIELKDRLDRENFENK